MGGYPYRQAKDSYTQGGKKMKQRPTATVLGSAALVLGFALYHIPALSAKEAKITMEKTPVLLAMGRRDNEGTVTEDPTYGTEASPTPVATPTEITPADTGVPQTGTENFGSDADSTGGAPQRGIERSTPTPTPGTTVP